MKSGASVAIIGAGIGGLATAVALQNAGFEVKLYEKTSELREVGAGISLWANATAVLKQLGLLEEAIAKSAIIFGLRVKDWRGNLLTQTNVEKYDTPSICIHRRDLIELLGSRCNQTSIYLGRTFKSFEQSETGVTVFFDGNEAVETDLLIGADGINSRVRAQIKGEAKPIYRGYAVWRGVVNAPPSVEVSNYATETWGCGNRFGLVPMGSNRFFWYATNNQKQNLRLPADERKALLLDLFRDCHEPIPKIIEATNATDILQNDCYDRAPENGWSQKRVCLIGDAAHPTTPNMGQGGCLALEDAVVLTKQLQTASEAQTAFKRFEQARYERAKLINKRSLMLSRTGQWQNPWFVAARNLLVKSIPQDVLENKFDKVYSYRA